MFTSRVISGRGRGKGLGFPTFNLEIPKPFDLAQGIYAVRVLIGGAGYKGAMHFGPIPVFGDANHSLEIFVLDYERTEAVSEISFEVIKYLRPIANFPNPEALAQQIAADVSAVRAL